MWLVQKKLMENGVTTETKVNISCTNKSDELQDGLILRSSAFIPIMIARVFLDEPKSLLPK